MSSKSCIYEGTVYHHRRTPVKHHFRYQLFMMYVDLEQLPTLFRNRWFWSTGRWAPAWFRRKDHFGDPKESLAESVRKLVHDRTGMSVTGKVFLLTHFRYFGFLINPISLFYCFDQAGSLQAVVAEVTNTPWQERHCYVLDRQTFSGSETTGKAMHVSPFMNMNFEYRFKIDEPASTLSVGIENHSPVESDQRSANPTFDAKLELEQRPMTGWNLSRVLIRYPLMTIQVFAAIHWQAFRLWLKRVPFLPHPMKSKKRDDVVNWSAER